MRKIEFRGKVKRPKDTKNTKVSINDKKDGEWVHGDLEIHRKDDKMLLHLYNKDGEYYRQYYVDPDTIGQFTGLSDKNGKEIYEGDIVEVYDFTSVYASKYKGVVKMVDCTWVVEHEFYNSPSYSKLVFDDFAQQKTEIIGNIYDNPDLITFKIDTHKEDKQ